MKSLRSLRPLSANALASTSYRLAPVPGRALATAIQETKPSTSRHPNPSFPCVDAHDLRTQRLEEAAREKGTREPLRTSFPAREDREDPQGEEPSYVVRS